MTYVAQLLPNLEEARLLREALAEYAPKDDRENDVRWKLLAQLTADMNRKR